MNGCPGAMESHRRGGGEPPGALDTWPAADNPLIPLQLGTRTSTAGISQAVGHGQNVFPAGVLSIGNLTLGGTGKTPVV